MNPIKVAIIGLDLFPTSKAPMMLVVNATELEAEEAKVLPADNPENGGTAQ